MDVLTQIAEARIRDAVDRGELDNLPGSGRPLAWDDDRGVPEELRVAYRVLRNAGFVPPEVELRREIASVEALVQLASDRDPQHRRALQKLALLRLRLGEMRRARGAVLDGAYEARLLERLR